MKRFLLGLFVLLLFCSPAMAQPSGGPTIETVEWKHVFTGWYQTTKEKHAFYHKIKWSGNTENDTIYHARTGSPNRHLNIFHYNDGLDPPPPCAWCGSSGDHFSGMDYLIEHFPTWSSNATSGEHVLRGNGGTGGTAFQELSSWHTYDDPQAVRFEWKMCWGGGSTECDMDLVLKLWGGDLEDTNAHLSLSSGEGGGGGSGIEVEVVSDDANKTKIKIKNVYYYHNAESLDHGTAPNRNNEANIYVYQKKDATTYVKSDAQGQNDSVKYCGDANGTEGWFAESGEITLWKAAPYGQYQSGEWDIKIRLYCEERDEYVEVDKHIDLD